jgi:hypothetical protein
MSVKIHLMQNSKILIDANNDLLVATSLLEASNLVVLKVVMLSVTFFSFKAEP